MIVCAQSPVYNVHTNRVSHVRSRRPLKDLCRHRRPALPSAGQLTLCCSSPPRAASTSLPLQQGVQGSLTILRTCAAMPRLPEDSAHGGTESFKVPGALAKGANGSYKAASLSESFEGTDVEREMSREFQVGHASGAHALRGGCQGCQATGAPVIAALLRGTACHRQRRPSRSMRLQQLLLPVALVFWLMVAAAGGLCPNRNPAASPAPLQGKQSFRKDVGAGTWLHAGWHLATTIATPAACECLN